MDEIPAGVDAAVWQVLRAAHAQRARVTIALRGDPTRAQPVRVLVGCPVRFDLSPRGQLYVALNVTEGTELRVVVERIAWAKPAASDDSGVIASPRPTVDVPTAVVLADDVVLRELLVTVLAIDGWHAEPLGLLEAKAAALASPAVVTVACTARRAEATFAAVRTLRAEPALANTPLLVVAREQMDIAPALRRVPRSVVLVAPFGVAEISNALATLMRLPRRTGSSG